MGDFRWGQSWTPIGPQGARRFTPGPSTSDPHDFVDLDGTLYFVAGDVLFRSDGTVTGTVPLTADLDLRVSELAVSGPTLLFSAYGQLWRSDGSVAGTALLTETSRCCGGPSSLTAVGRGVFFAAYGDATGEEIWHSDGTERGTSVTRDINPGIDTALCHGIRRQPPDLTASEDRVYFVADDGVHGQELWSSDGSSDGTRLVADIEPGSDGSFDCSTYPQPHPSSLTNVGGRIFFVAERRDVGRELWVADAQGAFLVKDIRPEGSSEPLELADANGMLIFSADDGINGREVWRSDGTEVGTIRVSDIAPGPLSSDPTEFRVVGQNVYFAADDNHRGRELWAVSLGAIGAMTPTPLATASATPTSISTASATATAPSVRETSNAGCAIGRSSAPSSFGGDVAALFLPISTLWRRRNRRGRARIE